MSLSDQDVVASYDGTGAQTQFAISQQIQSKTQIEVYLLNETTGALTLQTETTDFTFQAIAIPTYVTFVVAPTVSQKVIIKRVTPKTQSASYSAVGPFSASSHEAALDKIVQMIQELFYTLKRTLRVSDAITDGSLSSFDMTLPYDLIGGASRVLQSNSGGTGWELGATADEIVAAQGYAEAASDSADAAAASASAASTSATAADASEAAALASEVAAAASEAAAADALVRSVGSTLTPAGTTQTVNWDPDQIQKVDLGAASGDVTLTFSNPQAGRNYTLFTIQGATPRDVIWPANVKWPQGQKLILTQANDGVDKVELVYDGTNYYADSNVGYA